MASFIIRNQVVWPSSLALENDICVLQGPLLHASVRRNDLDSVRNLTQNQGADIDCVYYGSTPLLLAVQQGYTDLAMWLIDKDCDATRVDINGKTAFEEAVVRDQVQVVKQLIQKGVSPDLPLSSGETALTFAAHRKLTYLSRILVDGGSDVNLRDSRGQTSLYIAAQQGCTGVMESLLRAGGVALDDPCQPDDATPLIAAVSNDQLAATRLLIKAGCDLNHCDRHGWSALWHSVTNCNELLVSALISAGADVTVKDSEGRTVLEEAKDNESEEILEILISAPSSQIVSSNE